MSMLPTIVIDTWNSQIKSGFDGDESTVYHWEISAALDVMALENGIEWEDAWLDIEPFYEAVGFGVDYVTSEGTPYFKFKLPESNG